MEPSRSSPMAHAFFAVFLLAFLAATLLAATSRSIPLLLPTTTTTTYISGDCSPIDCSDPELFHLMMRAAIDAFPDIHFSRFGRPAVASASSCDLAWRARAASSSRDTTYKDYRRFEISRSPPSCSYSVASIGGYHSGPNARKRRRNNSAAAAEVPPPPPAAASEGEFSAGKYLAYTGGGDRCKPMSHYLRSLLCAVAEAQYLNRTLVVDLSLCLAPAYAAMAQAEEGKHFSFYFDLDHFKSSAPVIDDRQFWSNWDRWSEKGCLRVRLAEDHRVMTPMKLARTRETLIVRKFGDVEPGNYWYHVCEGEAEPVVRPPWRLVRRSRGLMGIASAVVSKMGGDFDSIHVGTSSEGALQKIIENVDAGRHVYVAVAGKEMDMVLLDALGEKYTVHYLDEFAELWGVESEWYMETKKLNNGMPVEFDGYMREMVDKEVFLKGKKKVELLQESHWR